jgi:formylglycine-generating enzyme required for sulfatase activity
MKIFISYRRAEDNKSYIVGVIHEKLSEVFGKENVFRDTYDIPSGAEWMERLQREVNSCKVMLVVIGPDWVNLAHTNGKKRLFDPQDVTRWEIETGLRRSREENISFIPVFITGARFPTQEELPPSLHELLKKQAISLRNFPDFDHDMERLIRDIRRSNGFELDQFPIDYFEPETIRILGGPFWMGSPEGSGAPAYESPQHEVELPTYRIGKYPVANALYEEFVRETYRLVTPVMGWDGQRVPTGCEKDPVIGVTWYEALAYCQWLTKKTGRKYSLPNEAQWEKACRAGKNFLYPWGNELDPKRSNHGCDTLAAVDAYPPQNEFGLYDLVGNVRQWTCSLWGEKRQAPDPPYAYPWKDDRRNDINANSQIRRVVRGGSVKDGIITLRCSSRSGQSPEDAGLPGMRHGFRIVINE